MNYHTLLHSPIVSSKTVPLIDKARKTNASVLIPGRKGNGKRAARENHSPYRGIGIAFFLQGGLHVPERSGL